MSGGPNVYNVEYQQMLLDISDRPQSGAMKSIAMALNEEEERRFNEYLARYHISESKKRDLMRFFITQFLYGAFNMAGRGTGVMFKKCKSSWIESYGYDEKKKKLYLQFASGPIYAYIDVPNKVYKGFVEAESKGKYHNKYLINSYKCKKVK
ncbi:MAG: KTSC domain-containing protein [Mycoplasmoidaceae bacterium]|nr:KTSC domain-containing protein [Mycoplasmoidaceae bacterium]